MRALEHGFFLCSKLKSSLTILYVIEIPPFLYIQSQKLVDSIMLTLENEAKGILIDGKIQGKKSYFLQKKMYMLFRSEYYNICHFCM